ncbi:OTU-domain-containing protein [Mytilinidion resinicola]|uniref:Ubiquitin thioesterase OTU n=1 Tax=Mytilinidion resinicola TaxID=574789 RepID=A0A6A6YZ10_9PEZI|nr:OTU-domain-containing protein [Mytilinidion resinicola]KAF2814176.1 OTU-domain-containing protein [Mytilinidion resinicola]
MRLRIRAPSGVSTITLSDDATVSDLLTSISEASSLPEFDLKWGFPPQSLDPSLYGLPTLLKETDLELNGEQLIVLARESEGLAQASTSEPSSQSTSNTLTPPPIPTKSKPKNQMGPLSLKRRKNAALEDPPEIPLSSHGATVVLRVMPDDNSCLFRAISSAVLSDELDAMTELRSVVAQAIQSDPEKYNAVTLEQTPDEYCKWIQMESSWGGSIELTILSEQLGVEICSIDVENLHVYRFNEGQPRRCIVVYSGVHYDTIAISPSDPPHTHADLGAELDQKVFDADADEILEAAVELCRKLQKGGYYTNTQKFSIKCNLCGWRGKGEKEAVKHATATGHSDFGEGD